MLQADYLDIIFDNRNKTYGGYELRKHYNNRVKKAGLFALLGVTAVFSFSFIAANRAPKEGLTGSARPTVINVIDYPPPPPPKEMPKILPPPTPPATVKTNIFNIPKITDEDIKPDEHMTEVKDLANSSPGRITDTGSIDATMVTSVKSGTATHVVATAEVAGPPRWVEQMPLFPGDMQKYLGNIIRYPEAARAGNIQGRVIVEFIVSEDGSVTHARVTRGIGGGCDEEALRVVGAMPKWKPGRQNGIPVKVLYTIPIKFQLD